MEAKKIKLDPRLEGVDNPDGYEYLTEQEICINVGEIERLENEKEAIQAKIDKLEAKTYCYDLYVRYSDSFHHSSSLADLQDVKDRLLVKKVKGKDIIIRMMEPDMLEYVDYAKNNADPGSDWKDDMVKEILEERASNKKRRDYDGWN